MIIETPNGRYSVARLNGGRYSVRRCGCFTNTLVGYFDTLDEAKAAVKREGET